jgi:hypothetical protein
MRLPWFKRNKGKKSTTDESDAPTIVIGDCGDSRTGVFCNGGNSTTDASPAYRLFGSADAYPGGTSVQSQEQQSHAATTAGAMATPKARPAGLVSLCNCLVMLGFVLFLAGTVTVAVVGLIRFLDDYEIEPVTIILGAVGVIILVMGLLVSVCCISQSMKSGQRIL